MRKLFPCRCLAVLLCAAAAPAAWGDGPAGDRKAPGWYLRGVYDLDLRARTEAAATDWDVMQRLSLSFGERGDGRISGVLAGMATHDLDGFSRPDPFASLSDTRGRNFARLHAAYIDVTPRGGFMERVRLGRQRIDEIPGIVRMDGVAARTGRLDPWVGTRLVAFGGVPEHPYESSRRGDAVFGAGIELAPAASTRLGVYYASLRDAYKTRHVDTSARATHRDDVVAVDFRQGLLDQRLLLAASYCHLNGKPRDAAVRLNYETPCGRTGVRLAYRALFTTEDALSTALDPYVSVLRTYRPYHEFEAALRREMTERLGVEAGVFVRRLERAADVGPFNREFERYFAAVHLADVPLEGSGMSATFSLYDTGSDRMWAVDGEWTQTFRERLKVALGTGYALYKEDRYTLSERFDVRSGFVRVAYDVRSWLTVRARYCVENDDARTTHVFETGLRIRF